MTNEDIDGIFDDASVEDFMSLQDDESDFCLGCTISMLVEDGLDLLDLGQSPEIVLDTVMRLLSARLISAIMEEKISE